MGSDYKVEKKRKACTVATGRHCTVLGLKEKCPYDVGHFRLAGENSLSFVENNESLRKRDLLQEIKKSRPCMAVLSHIQQGTFKLSAAACPFKV